MVEGDNLFLTFKFLIDGFSHFENYFLNKTESVSQLLGSLTKLRRFNDEVCFATTDNDTHFANIIKDFWYPINAEIEKATELFGMTYVTTHVVHVLKHCRIEGQL